MRWSLKLGLFTLACSGWIVVCLELGHAPVPARTAATFLFAGFAPGLAVVFALRSRDFVERFVLSIAMSLALDVIVAESLALVHLFTGLLASLILASLTTIAVAVTAARHARRPTMP